MAEQETKYGERFDADCDEHLPSKNNPARKTKAYWQAQCAFRSLKVGGNVGDLKERLRGRNRSKDPVIKKQDPPRSRPKQTARRGGRSINPSSIQAIQDQDPPRSLPKQTARRSGWPVSLPRSMPNATSPSSLRDQEGQKQPTRPKQTARRGGHHASTSTRPSTPTSNTGRITKASKQTEWDITGDWDIECDRLSGFFPGPERELSMEISHDTAKPGSYMATFDFNVIEGVLRISCPKPKKSDKELRGTYIYRGRETGESEIQLGSDRTKYTIVFKDKDMSLEGEFSGSAVGRVSFTGTKEAKGSERKASSAAEWDSLSEEQYEYARVNRWR